MPYRIEHRKGQKRPWKIVRRVDNRTVGSSLTKKNAEASIRARLMGGHPR